MSLDVRVLQPDCVALVAEIDRTEHVDVEYEVVNGRLTERPVSFPDIEPWDPVGTGVHSVAAHVEFCRGAVDEGGVLLGAFDADELLGLAIVNPTFEPPMAWLAFLHVSRPHRRRGAATALWRATTDLSRATGATSMYVSATPTGSAVGFYLRQGCVLADPVHPALLEAEPDDIHLICPLP